MRQSARSMAEKSGRGNHFDKKRGAECNEPRTLEKRSKLLQSPDESERMIGHPSMRSSCSKGVTWDDDVVVGRDEDGEDHCLDGSAEPAETQAIVESGNGASAKCTGTFAPSQEKMRGVDHGSAVISSGDKGDSDPEMDCEKDSGTSAKYESRLDSVPGDHAAATAISTLRACQHHVATAMQALKDEKDTLKEYFRLKMNLSESSAHYSKTLTQLDTQIEFTAESVKDMTEELKELKKEEAALLASMKKAS
jgi:hypothetical protein